MDFKNNDNNNDEFKNQQNTDGGQPHSNEQEEREPAEQNMSTSGAESENHPEEATTPFQIPVRDSSESQNPFQAQEQLHSDSTQQIPNYNTYREWQEQFSKEKKKKRGKKPLIIVAGILVTAMVFTAGALVGGISNIFIDESTAQGSTAGSDLPADSPKLEITQKATAISAGDDGLTGAEIFKKVSPSIVSIQADSMRSGESSSGSGIIMKESGYIITNNHVVEGADKVTVILNDGKKYQAETIGLDKKTDLAVIKINAADLKPAEFGDSTKLVVGDRAFAIGSPGGVQLQNSFTGGYISAINRDITIDDRVMTLLQTDASINPGNSGGALINQYGQVIGVTSAKLGISYYEGLGFAIPMSTAEGIINELIANGFVTGRPAIGISGYNVTEQMAAYYQVPQGVLINAVDNRSDAYKKGVKRGDIIIGINGTETKSMTEVNTVKNKLKAGDSITLNLYRAGKKLNVAITLVDENNLGATVEEPDNSQPQTTPDQPGQEQPQNQNPFGGDSFFQVP